MKSWRHGVAHGADLVLQLVLNPAVNDAQVKHLSRAIFSQVNARGGHSYIFGEAGRLARPVLYAALRDDLEAGHWQQLFAELGEPGELGEWSAAFESEAGMARLHNTRGFVQAIYLTASSSGRPELDAIAESAEMLLQSLP